MLRSIQALAAGPQGHALWGSGRAGATGPLGLWAPLAARARFRPPARTVVKKVVSLEAPADLEARIAAIPVERYRNFSIVAHVDHGKSTLSDRMLEHTGVIAADGGRGQVLDKLEVERERGITVKAQTCSMIYTNADDGLDYLLHLVDTPGHVDFRQEVARSYAACEGALILVDGSQGIQAQTVANFELASELGLELVPVINKVDLPHADVPRVTEALLDRFELLDPVPISAKTGLNVAALFPEIVRRIPAPTADANAPLRSLLVDSWFDPFMGVVLLVKVVDGQIRRGLRVASAHTGLRYDVKEVGIMYPDRVATKQISAGQLGYVITGMKKSQDAHVGDTFMEAARPVEPLPGFEEVKPMVFLGAFPAQGANFEQLEESIELLTLNDRSVTLEKETSNALGQGWRLGFLGTLHASVFQDRLQREHGGKLIFTAPTVPYKLVHKDGSEQVLTNPNEFPQILVGPMGVRDRLEPFVQATIHTPKEYVGNVVQLCNAYRGLQTDIEYTSIGATGSSAGSNSSEEASQARLRFLIPLAELINDFFGKLKGVTKGYASLDYEDAGYQSSDIVKLELLVNGHGLDALAKIMHSSQVDTQGRAWVRRFKEYLGHELFEVIIQARCGNKIIARETIKAKRKDVLAKLHAADVSRRKKLLAKQKEGRKSLQAAGRVSIPERAYQGFLSN